MSNQALTNLRLEVKVETGLKSVEVKFAVRKEASPRLLSWLVVVVLDIVVVVEIEA